MGFRERFDDNQLRAGFVALVQFGINGPGERLRIVRYDGNAAEPRNGGDMGVRDHVDGG